VAQFEFLMASSLDGVILSAADFQAERRISRLTGLTRKLNRTANGALNIHRAAKSPCPQCIRSIVPQPDS
jgi:hypothetical protein